MSTPPADSRPRTEFASLGRRRTNSARRPGWRARCRTLRHSRIDSAGQAPCQCPADVWSDISKMGVTSCMEGGN
jgi:hypothetical protein